MPTTPASPSMPSASRSTVTKTAATTYERTYDLGHPQGSSTTRRCGSCRSAATSATFNYKVTVTADSGTD